MTTTIPGLTSQTTTEDADLLVLQNIAANRTRTITYANFKNELAADMDIITSAQLASAIAGVTSAFQAADLAVKELVFGVGSKITVTSGPFLSTNPGTVLGFGTWVKEEAKYYAAHKSGDANFGTVGASIGALNHNHAGATESTVLNSTQIPSHTHTFRDTILPEKVDFVTATLAFDEDWEYRGGGFIGIGNASVDYDNGVLFYKNRTTAATGSTGGHSHNIASSTHLPPTIVEVVWRRTA